MPKKNIEGKFVDEPLPCVYGPPSWYNSNGTFDRSNPEVKEFLNEIEEIKERNRKQKEMRDVLQEMVDKPIENVYGPEPPIEMYVVGPEYVEKPIAKVYGPDPSVVTQTNDEYKEIHETSDDRKATKVKKFFLHLFGLFKKKS